MIDIRKDTGRPKGVNIKTVTTTMRYSGNWIAFKIDDWYEFNRLLKSKKKLGKNWYIGFSTVFNTAVRKARKSYTKTIPINNWQKITIKHYNLTNISDVEIVKLIIDNLN